MRLSHHPAMIIFPVLLLGVSFLSTWISLLPEGPGRFASVLEILVTAIMLVCLYEPLEHGLALWLALTLLFLGALYVPVLGILFLFFLPIWRCIKFFRDRCMIGNQVLSLSSGAIRVTGYQLERKELALVTCRQGFLGSIFHYGDLTFFTKKGLSLTYRYVKNPRSCRASIESWIEGESL